VLGDVDGDGPAGLGSAEGDLLPGDEDDASGGGPSLHGDRLGRGPRRWAGPSGAAQPADLVPGGWVGSGAQQLPGGWVEEGQGDLVDADADRAAAEDVGGEDLPAGQGDDAGLVDDPVDLDRGTGLGRRQRRRSGRPGPGPLRTCEVLH
jgi:hypothetical protein